MDISVLHNLGLTKNEVKVYISLIENGSSPAGIITEKTGIHRRNVYDSIERLIGKGLVGFIIIKGKKFFEAVDPKYFHRLLQEKKETIEEYEKSFIGLYPFLDGLYKKSKEKQELTFYRGEEAIKLLLNNVLDSKSVNHVLGAQLLDDKYNKFIETYHARRIKEKIHEKIIFNINAYKRGLEVAKMPYVDVRFFPTEYSNELTLNIYNGRVGLLVYSKSDPISIMIKNKKIYDGFLTYFEMLWNISLKSKDVKNQPLS